MAQKTLSVLGNLRVAGAVVIDENLTDFPSNPKIGTLALKGQSLYAYMVMNGFETWYPIFQNVSNAYQHTQAIPNTVWTITHNLGSQDVWYSIKNTLGQKEHEASIEYVSDNQIKLHFNEAIAGTAMFVGPSDVNLGLVNASQINIGTNGSVVIDDSGVRVNGEYILTAGNLPPLVNNALASLKGAANGVASLDANGKIPSSQLPSTVTLTSQLTNDSGFLTSSDLNYNNLLNKPVIPYDIAGSVFGVPANSEVIIRMRSPRAFTLLSGQPNAQAKSGTAASASTVLTIAKNGTSIGTITFAAGALTGTFAFSNSVSVAVGDLITVTGPASADASLADIDVSLVAVV